MRLPCLSLKSEPFLAAAISMAGAIATQAVSAQTIYAVGENSNGIARFTNNLHSAGGNFSLNNAASIALDPQQHLWAYSSDGVIKEFSSSGTVLHSYTYNSATANAITFGYNGNLFILTNSGGVREYSVGPGGLTFLKQYGPTSLVAQYVAVDTAGHVFTNNYATHQVNEFNASGNLIHTFGNPAGDDAHGIAVDASGHLWAGHDGRIEEYNTATGSLINTITGLGNPIRNALAFDSAGNLVETNYTTIETLTTSGTVLASASNLGYNYQLAASTPLDPITPEPGSLALLTGPVLAGMWLKRKRNSTPGVQR